MSKRGDVTDIETRKLTGVIKNARLISQEGVGAAINGDVVVDYRGRFNKDDWIRTSLIIDKDFTRGDALVRTRNSLYQVVNWLGEEYDIDFDKGVNNDGNK